MFALSSRLVRLNVVVLSTSNALPSICPRVCDRLVAPVKRDRINPNFAEAVERELTYFRLMSTRRVGDQKRNMKAKHRIFPFSAVLFSLLLTNGSLAQSQVSPTTTPPLQQPPTESSSQSTQGDWIGWAGGAIVALIGVGFGLVQFRKSQRLEQEKLESQQRLEQEKLELQQRLEQEKLESQQRLEQEKRELQQRLGQEKLESQQKLEQEKLELQQKLEQEKLESQQKLEQEKQAWERQKLTWEAEKFELEYDLKLERGRQEAELHKQLLEAEAEETATGEAEAEAIEERALEEEMEVYRDKVLADLRNEKIQEWKRQNLN